MKEWEKPKYPRANGEKSIDKEVEKASIQEELNQLAR